MARGGWGHPSVARRTWLLVVAVAVSAVTLSPLWWATISSLRPRSAIFRYLSPLSIESIWPTPFTFRNYLSVLSGDFRWALINSFIVSASTIVIGLAVCAVAAFAFAVLDFPLRRAAFAVVVVSFLLPFESIAIPLARLLGDLGMQNTYNGLILPGIGNGMAIFALRQFFLGIPRELSESARVDGLGWWRVLWRIYLPLSKPALVGAGLVLFIMQWHAFLWPLLIVPDPAMQVAPVAIAQFAQENDVDFGAMFAGAILTALVPLFLLLYFQRYYLASIAASAGKE
jgi:putative chitobiose transport system permease protein